MSKIPEPREEATDASSIPAWQFFMKPILEVLSDGQVWQKKALEESALDHANIPREQRLELLPSGQYRALNRMGWAMSFLTRAQAISKPVRAVFQITDTGRKLLVENPEGIAEQALKAIPAFQEYVPQRGRRSTKASTLNNEEPNPEEDPIELIESGIATFESEVAADLFRRLREQHPDFFEQAVVDLLIAMGYGGAEQRVRRLGRTGDGGVDGVIDQDALGLNRVYVQAKRYGAGNSVQRPEL